MTEQPTTTNRDEGELATVTVLHPTVPHPASGPAPAEPASGLGGSPEATTGPGAVLEGKVIPSWELDEDPEGDRPWIHPALKTKDGIQARRRYLQRVARRKARRWVARQTTVRGIVPAAWRGAGRIHRWTRGVEGMTADAAKARAELLAAEAKTTARRARFTISPKERKVLKAAVEQAQQQAQLALTTATAAKATAKSKFIQRASLAYGGLAAVDVTGLVLEGGLGLTLGLLVNAGVLARVGRTPDLTPEALEELERQETGAPDRFELGMTPRAFEQMLLQALTEEIGIAVFSMQVHPKEWGFEVDLVLKNQTPQKLADSLADLEACLPGVRTNSILLQQSAAARNECTMRIPGNDPWRAVPALPYRAPKSVETNSIHAAQIGADMSGRVLALPLKRTNAAVIGKSRSGKSTMLRAILDALTATEDRIIIGIDLGSYGSGFGPYRKAMSCVARTPTEARKVLEWVLAIGKGRPALFERFGMGLNWESSPTQPGITVVIDEFPALVSAAKAEHFPKLPDDFEGEKPLKLDELVKEIHQTSAKSDITLIVASQGVTRERIGANTWLAELPVQVMCAVDKDDIIQIAGSGAMAQGWRPDRLLPAMGNAVNDASVAYVLAGGDYCEPIPYRACILPDDQAEARAQERADAGLLQLDKESAWFAGGGTELLPEESAPAYYGDDDQDQEPTGATGLLKLARVIFDEHDDPSGMSPEELYDALVETDPETWDPSNFGVQEGEEPVAADIIRTVFKAVLEPQGLKWSTDKYRPKGAKSTARGYCLRDLKTLLGED